MISTLPSAYGCRYDITGLQPLVAATGSLTGVGLSDTGLGEHICAAWLHKSHCHHEEGWQKPVALSW